MVVAHDIEFRLVSANDKRPVKEYNEKGYTYSEVEPKGEYLMSVQRLEYTFRGAFFCRFRVNEKDLGYHTCFMTNRKNPLAYGMLHSGPDGIDFSKPLRLPEKPGVGQIQLVVYQAIDAMAFRRKLAAPARAQWAASLPKRKVKETLLIKKKPIGRRSSPALPIKKREEAKHKYTNPVAHAGTCLSSSNPDGPRTEIRNHRGPESALGQALEAAGTVLRQKRAWDEYSAKPSPETSPFLQGRFLFKVTLNFCTVPNLIVLGVLPRTSLWEYARMKQPERLEPEDKENVENFVVSVKRTRRGNEIIELHDDSDMDTEDEEEDSHSDEQENDSEEDEDKNISQDDDEGENDSQDKESDMEIEDKDQDSHRDDKDQDYQEDEDKNNSQGNGDEENDSEDKENDKRNDIEVNGNEANVMDSVKDIHHIKDDGDVDAVAFLPSKPEKTSEL